MRFSPERWLGRSDTRYRLTPYGERDTPLSLLMSSRPNVSIRRARGRNLSPRVARVELVKNAYYADATCGGDQITSVPS